MASPERTVSLPPFPPTHPTNQALPTAPESSLQVVAAPAAFFLLPVPPLLSAVCFPRSHSRFYRHRGRDRRPSWGRTTIRHAVTVVPCSAAQPWTPGGQNHPVYLGFCPFLLIEYVGAEWGEGGTTRSGGRKERKKEGKKGWAGQAPTLSPRALRILSAAASSILLLPIFVFARGFVRGCRGFNVESVVEPGTPGLAVERYSRCSAFEGRRRTRCDVTEWSWYLTRWLNTQDDVVNRHDSEEQASQVSRQDGDTRGRSGNGRDT